ncbi:CU044_5270 family protein [Nonomuraea sp. NPDC005650]|uniref:CU044_5270 family protein n=1 Tax=Nonomuraea sp. NPDC005650 TaxID=3157045 RepID=UPI00339DA9BA
MDEDEIRTFADGRPAVPPYGAEARARARERLLTEARGGGRFRLPRFGWQAAAAFGVTVVLVGGVAVALTNRGAGGDGTAMSATETVSVSSSDELTPRPGQFILVESDTMYGSMTADQNSGEPTRHLYRTHRKIWQSVDGSANGLLLIEGREPQPWPGTQLPENAKNWQGSDWHTLPSCASRTDDYRTDYAYLSTLPTDVAGMRARLYKMPATAGDTKGAENDRAAFDHLMDLVRETYLPKAQRDALFEAAKSIPGVQVAEGVADSAGRKGVALGRVDPQGVLTQGIFDPATHLFMGERQTVVDDKIAQAPKGSVLGLTAQLKVSVVDALPQATPKDEGQVACAPSSAEPAPGETSSAVPSESPSDEGGPEPVPTMTVSLRATDDSTAPPEPVISTEPSTAPAVPPTATARPSIGQTAPPTASVRPSDESAPPTAKASPAGK